MIYALESVERINVKFADESAAKAYFLSDGGEWRNSFYQFDSLSQVANLIARTFALQVKQRDMFIESIGHFTLTLGSEFLDGVWKTTDDAEHGLIYIQLPHDIRVTNLLQFDDEFRDRLDWARESVGRRLNESGLSNVGSASDLRQMSCIPIDDEESIERIAEALLVRFEWLRFGTGEAVDHG